MSRYIAVCHEWWMHHKSWQIKELAEATSPEHAEQMAAKIAYDADESFNHSAVIVLEIADRECLLPRRLTWRERVTGQLRSEP